MSDHPYPHGRTFQDCEAEIERLRADLLSAHGQLEEMSGEVARLRGLLHECWSWYIAAPTGFGSDLWQRVREALDDAD